MRCLGKGVCARRRCVVNWEVKGFLPLAGPARVNTATTPNYVLPPTLSRVALASRPSRRYSQPWYGHAILPLGPRLPHSPISARMPYCRGEERKGSLSRVDRPMRSVRWR